MESVKAIYMYAKSKSIFERFYPTFVAEQMGLSFTLLGCVNEPYLSGCQV